MKTKFNWVGIVTTLIVVISTFFVACNKDEINDVVNYRGQVVYINTTTPFPDLTVKVTDGTNTHCQAQTGGGGAFALKVHVDDIDGNYYLLAGDSTCIPKRVKLGSYGQAEVDLGVIEVEGPALPTIVTTPIQTVTANSATLGGEIQTDGRLTITARGVCYGEKAYPTVDGLHTNDGTGKGAFTSNLKELKFKTVYYARAYATNHMGTAYGEQVKFITEEGVAVVVTDSVYRVTAHTAKCKGHVVSDGGFAVTKRGTCWSKRPDPTIDDDYTDNGSGTGEFTSTLKDLLENTTYYVRTYATNSTTTSYGEQIIITTLDGLAVVETDSISTVTATGFTAYGTVVSDCDIPVTARGFCYSTKQYPTIENEHTTSGRGLGKYQSNIVNLKVGTTYYVRAYAANETATIYGEQISITTLDGLAVVKTDSVSNISATAMMVYGDVVDNGSFDVTERGVCYSATNTRPITSDSKVICGKGEGTFIAYLTELSASTKYYVRTYAANENGTTYSEIISAHTKDGNASVSLGEITNITALTASASVTVTDAGSATMQNCGICWSTNPNPTVFDNKVVAIGKQLNSAYTCNMTDLQPNTKYYVRAYGTTDITTAYSEQKTFITQDGAAMVVVGAITDITALTAFATVTVTGEGGASLQSCGICWGTNPSPTVSDNKVVAIGKQLNSAYPCNMADLQPNTKYYVRAYGTTDITTAYSEQVTFKTTTGLPTISTATTKATSTTITSGGTISSDGGYSITARGVCYSTNNSNPTLADNYTTAGIGTGTFYSTITNVSVSTTYYVCAYATNSIGTAYGEVKIVMTGNGLPSVTTTAIGENVTETTAISGGQVTNDGGYTIITRGVCWNTLPYPTINDNKTIDGSGTGYYSSTITGIDWSSNDIYYVRAYATNEKGTAYGKQETITKEIYEYSILPMIEFGGYIYRLYPDLGGTMSWDKANTLSENLVFAGYDDWGLPTLAELRAIMDVCHTGWRYTNGGEYDFNKYDDSADYWTRPYSEMTYLVTLHYFNKDHIGQNKTDNKNTSVRVRPVRKYPKNQ